MVVRLAGAKLARVQRRSGPRAEQRGKTDAVAAVVGRLWRVIRCDARRFGVVGAEVAVGRGFILWMLVAKGQATVSNKTRELTA